MRAIKEAPGANDDEDDVAALERKMQEAGMPTVIWIRALGELKRLRKMQPQQHEYNSSCVYLEFLAAMPWQQASEERELDLKAAKERFDNDHYGLVKAKQRIIEYLAVLTLKSDARSPVLCFVGPPGVGKTSFASSIAAALGRKFIRISLGGVNDEADIRWQRTCFGSMPGRLIDGLKRVGVCNPVVLLDEIDKTGSDGRGDPASALLEVLDPQQNKTFNDRYLNVPFDLSKVIFVATANSIQPITRQLLDRMEVINLPGYTPEEKLTVAMQHLIPRVLEQHGLSFDFLQVPEAAVKLVIQRYTREAGVRDLQRKLAALARDAAVRVVEQRLASPFIVDEAVLEEVLGPPKYYDGEAARRVAPTGVSIGLAWTANGGKLLFVEAVALVGRGDLHFTGQLGNVMEESARVSLTWVRRRAAELKLVTSDESNLLQGRDIHIHLPAGAVSKEGPSAGVAIATALVSLFSERRVRADTAMTGEMTLDGSVFPVGDIEYKLIAAYQCGIKRVIVPAGNYYDSFRAPLNVLNSLEILFANSMEDVLEQAFDRGWPLDKRRI